MTQFYSCMQYMVIRIMSAMTLLFGNPIKMPSHRHLHPPPLQRVQATLLQLILSVLLRREVKLKTHLVSSSNPVSNRNPATSMGPATSKDTTSLTNSPILTRDPTSILTNNSRVPTMTANQHPGDVYLMVGKSELNVSRVGEPLTICRSTRKETILSNVK